MSQLLAGRSLGHAGPQSVVLRSGPLPIAAHEPHTVHMQQLRHAPITPGVAAGAFSVAPPRTPSRHQPMPSTSTLPFAAQVTGAVSSGAVPGACTPTCGGGGGATPTSGGVVSGNGGNGGNGGATGPPMPFVEGEVTSVGRRHFTIDGVLGEGAYARVWAARASTGGEEVAIKEMKCGQGPGILPDASLQRALFEIRVMQRLAGESENGADVAAPRVIEHQLWPLGPTAPGAYLYRVVMTRRPGKSLVSWLDERVASRRNRRSSANFDAHGLPREAPIGCGRSPFDARNFTSSAPDPTEEVLSYCKSFCAAVRVAEKMLTQLAPTFHRLNESIAYHRDVNARNILVHCPPETDACEGAAPANASRLVFSIVDFGSSTDAAAWLAGGEGSWQAENPTGDARYWGPASWVRFLAGAQGLSKEQALLRQYSRRLDIFAVAICALEAVAKLHTAEFPLDISGRSLSHMNFELQFAQCARRVARSWLSYWDIAVRSFDRLAEYSQLVCNGDQRRAYQTWQELSGGQIPQILSERLRELRTDLAATAEVCRAQPPTVALGNASLGISITLECLCDMIDEHGTFEWQELIAHSAAIAVVDATVAQPSWPQMLQQRRSGASVEHMPFAAPMASTGGSSSSTAAAASVTIGGASGEAQVFGGHAVTMPTTPLLRPAASVGIPHAPASNLTPPTPPLGRIQALAAPPLAHTSQRLPPTEGVFGPPRLSATAATMPPPSAAVSTNTATTAADWRGNGNTTSNRGTGSKSNLPTFAPPSATGPARSALSTSPLGLLGGTGPCEKSSGPADEHRNGRQGGPCEVPAQCADEGSNANDAVRPDVRMKCDAVDSHAAEEREHEALQILRQVEAEVRTLKKWYTEAIEAMRSPPFVASANGDLLMHSGVGSVDRAAIGLGTLTPGVVPLAPFPKATQANTE